MPMFFGNTRRKESSLSTAIRPNFGFELKPRKSNANLNDRPQTSGGATAAHKPQKDSIARFPFGKWPSMANRSTATLAIVDDSVRDSQLIGLAVGSPSDSLPPVATANQPSGRAAVHSSASKTNSSDLWHNEPWLVQQNEESTDPATKRWKSVSGLFNKKRPATPLRNVSEPVIEQHPQNAPVFREQETRRRSISFRRARKSQVVPSVPPINDKYKGASTSQLPLTGPVQHLDRNATPPNKKPALEIDIPQSGLDRYSVMFSSFFEPIPSATARPRQSLLARRNGVDSLTITSPSLIKPQSVLPLEEKDDHSPSSTLEIHQPYHLPESADAFPQRTHSLIPQGPQCRISVLPAPLFSHSTDNRRHLKHAHSAIGLLSTSKPSMLAPEEGYSTISDSRSQMAYPLTPRLAVSVPDTPPESPSVHPDDIYYFSYSRRNSAVSNISSTNTNQNPPSPSSSINSYSYFLAQAATKLNAYAVTQTGPPRLTTVPSSSGSSSDGNSTETTAASMSSLTDTSCTDDSNAWIPEKPTFLTLPSPRPSPALSCPPWDLNKAFPSPMCSSASPSPRMKFGYDAPHSPLIAVAKTVTVCVRAGQGNGQRPQFVVQECDGRARRAVVIGRRDTTTAGCGIQLTA